MVSLQPTLLLWDVAHNKCFLLGVLEMKSYDNQRGSHLQEALSLNWEVKAVR